MSVTELRFTGEINWGPISLEEMMFHIEKKLLRCHVYLVLFIDEMDNIRHDRDKLLTFLTRRQPNQIPRESILALVSNRL